MTRIPKTAGWLGLILVFAVVAESSASKIAFNRGSQNRMRLMVMADTGADPTAIHDFGKFSGGSDAITVSPPGPEGTWVAFDDVDWDLGGGAALYRVRADGSDLIKVLCSEGTDVDGTGYLSVLDVQWAPTGTEILVKTLSVTGADHLGLLPAGFAVGSGAVGAACDSLLLPIYDGSSGTGWVMEGTAAWNDDGTRIALFEFDANGDIQLVILERQTGWTPTIVPTDITYSSSAGFFSASPDWRRGGGDLLALPVPEGTFPHVSNWLRWVDVTTGAWGYLTESGSRLDGDSPSWSPDGSQLVFSDDRGDLIKWTYPDGPSEDMGSGTFSDWQRGPLPFCVSNADCQDGNPCTQDLCDFLSGDCSNLPEPDDTPCGTNGWCESGVCFEPECGSDGLPPCNDGNECTTNECSSWECVFEPVPAGLGCSDGDDCTENDQCDGAGSCIGDPIPGCGCLPKGASCTADGECCSGKCRGGGCR